jgi:hypothetical protein
MIMMAFTTSRKSPSVSMVAGSVKNTRIGFTKILSRPNTSATITAVYRLSTRTPGIKLASRITKRVVKRMLTSVFIVGDFFVKIEKAPVLRGAFNNVLGF